MSCSGFDGIRIGGIDSTATSAARYDGMGSGALDTIEQSIDKKALKIRALRTILEGIGLRIGLPVRRAPIRSNRRTRPL